MTELDELRQRVAVLEQLIMSLAEKLWIVAQHLSRLAEKK